MSLNGNEFLSGEINEVLTPNCSSNYYVFENDPPYLPTQDGKAEAICLLNSDSMTASWNIIKPCEPSCLIRGCDNGQTCISPGGGMIPRCICSGYTGKYCSAGFFFFSLFSLHLFHFLKRNLL